LIVEEYRAIVEPPQFRRFGFPPLWLEFLVVESLRLLILRSGLTVNQTRMICRSWLVTEKLRHFPRELREGVTVLSPHDYLAHFLAGNPKS
jgi:hypothetical protein